MKEKQFMLVTFRRRTFLRGEPTTEVLFISLEATVTCDTDGLNKALHSSFDSFHSSVDVQNLLQIFVGLCTDGVSVNIGSHSRLGMELKEKYPRIFTIWCIYHRLELEIQDPLLKSFLSDTKECMMHLSYLYKNKSQESLVLE